MNFCKKSRVPKTAAIDVMWDSFLVNKDRKLILEINGQLYIPFLSNYTIILSAYNHSSRVALVQVWKHSVYIGILLEFNFMVNRRKSVSVCLFDGLIWRTQKSASGRKYQSMPSIFWVAQSIWNIFQSSLPYCHFLVFLLCGKWSDLAQPWLLPSKLESLDIF